MFKENVLSEEIKLANIIVWAKNPRDAGDVTALKVSSIVTYGFSIVGKLSQVSSFLKHQPFGGRLSIFRSQK